ncbi:cobinamide kinase [Roseburia sp. AF22-2LB]|uniref:bifunctional adenosylcobinamide kinase/adenosylcobinamide-phosphate guanylyltransferase n=1 Tax=unclassified Roseburia TaxID=2637578 RepID=UPI000E540134|nr:MULTISPECIES: bifunctional adenosylcobinamide kinase/adenosylcobinamide-phosphate guanylyltransferase [unclassified Roseburia]RGG35450.1 cobinamide kinase [Roseburia sp. AF22-8AC]RGG40770.1 cobinamide kinase [Roseburia sp. AF22-2LB]RHS27098.1 cobinamide kinase [Roseburia sp. AF12-17LB]
MIALVIGGSGSGKSAYAEQMAVKAAGNGSLYYVATMQVYDEEGKKKVERHQKMRAGKGFLTIEQPRRLKEAAKKVATERVPAGKAAAGVGKTVLLECMSNLVANEMFSEENLSAVMDKEKIRQLSGEIINGVTALHDSCDILIIVTNQIFEDGIRYDASTMDYIRLLGDVNRQIAERAEQVVEVVAGIPIFIKKDGI